MSGISEWVLAGNPAWIWLVGLMWLANVVFLVFACRSYLAARAASRSTPAAAPDYRVATPAPSTTLGPQPGEHTLGDAVPREPVPVPLMVERFNSDSLLVPPDAAAATHGPAASPELATQPAVPDDALSDAAATASGDYARSPSAEPHPKSDAQRSQDHDAVSAAAASTVHGSSFGNEFTGGSLRERTADPSWSLQPVATAAAEPQAARDDLADTPAATQQDVPAAGNGAQQPGPDMLLAALRRIQEHPESTRPFRELIRALYLDQSVFTFDCLAGLNPGDRQLALALFKAWLAGTYDADRWEEAFRDSQLDSLGKEMFAAVPGDKAM